MRKKIIFLILSVFFLTGCNVNYELEYKDGVFKEKINIDEEKNEEIDYGITQVKKDKEKLKIDGKEYYKYNLEERKNKNYLDANYTYKKLNISKSPAISKCFEVVDVLEGDNYYYFNVKGNMICEYINDFKITFKTDKKVLVENASSKDKKKGIYTWDLSDLSKWNKSEGIKLMVSKEDEEVKSKKGSISIFRVIVLILLVIVIVIVLLVTKKKNDDSDNDFNDKNEFNYNDLEEKEISDIKEENSNSNFKENDNSTNATSNERDYYN